MELRDWIRSLEATGHPPNVSVVPCALHVHLHRQLHSGHICGIYDRYAIMQPYEPISRYEPTASWPG